MRRLVFLFLAVLAGCGSQDSDPVRVAESFHELRRTGDDRGLHGLLTETDRAAIPLARFPADVPAAVGEELLGWGHLEADSASLLRQAGDTALVLLHVRGGQRDTVRLYATHQPRKLWRWELDRVHWRVSLELTERAVLDSLAAAIQRAGRDATDSAAVSDAEAYLRAAELHPHLARLPDMEAARQRLRTAKVADALKVDLHLTRSITGAPYVEGRVENPTENRVATLRLVVRDAEGAEDRVELWTIEPGGRAPVWALTRLKKAPITHRVERIQVF